MASTNMQKLNDFYTKYSKGPEEIIDMIVTTWKDWNLNSAVLQKQYYEYLKDLTKKKDIHVKFKKKVKKYHKLYDRIEVMNTSDNLSVKSGNKDRNGQKLQTSASDIVPIANMELDITYKQVLGDEKYLSKIPDQIDENIIIGIYYRCN